MRRLEATFKEVPVKNYSLVNNFANQCTVSSIAYPQGVGKNKKAAKADAAKIAFNIILGFETFEDYGEGMCIKWVSLCAVVFANLWLWLSCILFGAKHFYLDIPIIYPPYMENVKLQFEIN